MAIVSTTVSVTTSPTLLAAADPGRRFIAFSNGSGSHIHIGGATVTATSGMRLDNHEDHEFQQQHPNDHTPGQAWYGIVSSGTQSVGVTISKEDSTT
jgi:hypothetical protein